MGWKFGMSGKGFPGPRSQELMKERDQHVPPGISYTLPVFIEEASGALIKDVDGNVFIDFAGGIGVCNFGHCHPKVVKAVQDQAQKYLHTCFMVAMYEPYVGVARRLNELTPGDGPKKTALFNSGAEAVENAVKIARRYTKKTGIVALENAFHGRTLMTMTLTSKVRPYKYGFGPFAPEVYKIPSPYCYRCKFGLSYPGCNIECARYLEHFFIVECPAENVAAVIAEPVQGEGGFLVPPKEYFKVLQDICRRHGVLLIIDEIQSGFYRTGYRFAIEHFGIVPDIITTAKSIAAGLPLSAVTGRAEIMDVAGPGEIGGTYGGNPLSCVAACTVMDLMEEENMGQRSRQVGEMARKRFEEMKEKYEIIGDIRGLGPMIALELVKDRVTKEPAADETKALAQKCHEKGALVITAGILGNVVRVLMPVVITDEQLNYGLDVIEESLKEL